MKPDWSKAPSWANWWAMDSNGRCVWYIRKPLLQEEKGFWSSLDFASTDQNACPHWKETLQQRAVELKAGGVYRLRNGWKAWVLKEGDDLMKGAMEVKNEICSTSWLSSGKSHSKVQDYDIVAEWEGSCE